jgi:hypothetical protein
MLVMLAMPLVALAMMAVNYTPLSLLGASSLAMFFLGVFVAYRSLRVLMASTPDDPGSAPAGDQVNA